MSLGVSRANSDEAQEANRLDSLVVTRAADGTVTLELKGSWRLHRGMSRDIGVLQKALSSRTPIETIRFDSRQLQRWDFALITFLSQVEAICASRKIALDQSGLPPGVRRLLQLAGNSIRSAPEDGALAQRRRSLAERAGAATIRAAQSFREVLEFIGQLTVAFGRFASGRARYLRTDVWAMVEATGADALAIVALISYLVGVILAFMGAVQLTQFGASIYVADLVAIGITREMGAMMTAIIMAGRTGASFAAQLGTMKVRQEVEALQTMGIAPMEFLVLPRVIALVLMIPLLCLYSDFLGILGGATIGVSMLHLSFFTYLKESAKALYPSGVLGGLFKSFVYGILIAVTGCYQGMKCGSSAAAVGEVTTAAVVNSIILIVVACGLLSLVFHVVGI